MIAPAYTSSGATSPVPWLDLLESVGVPFAVADIHGAVLSQSKAMRSAVDGLGERRLLATAARDLASSLQASRSNTRVARSVRGLPAIGVVVATSPFRLLVVLEGHAIGPRGAVLDCDGGLTTREREVAVLLASSLSTRDIAVRLGISLHTVRRHTEAVFRKLRVRSRVAVAEVVLGAREPAGHVPRHVPRVERVSA